MFPLPPGFGVPDGALRFDHLTTAWYVAQVVMLAVLAGSLWLLWRDPPCATGGQGRRAGRRPTRPTPVRRSRGHVRRAA